MVSVSSGTLTTRSIFASVFFLAPKRTAAVLASGTTAMSITEKWVSSPARVLTFPVWVSKTRNMLSERNRPSGLNRGGSSVESWFQVCPCFWVSVSQTLTPSSPPPRDQLPVGRKRQADRVLVAGAELGCDRRHLLGRLHCRLRVHLGCRRVLRLGRVAGAFGLRRGQGIFP